MIWSPMFQRLAAASICFVFAGCAGGEASLASAPQAAHASARRDDSEPTLYILNQQSGKTPGWVGVYSGAGATFVRNVGTIENATSKDYNYPTLTADNSEHLYLYQATVTGRLLSYDDYGATQLQTLQQRHPFDLLTLDASGNLFAGCGNQESRVCEFKSKGNGELGTQPSRKILSDGAHPFFLAVDPKGDVGVSGGAGGFYAYAPHAKKAYWTISGSNVIFLSEAFDASGKLYIEQEPRTGSGPIGVYVYAPRGSSPKYRISNGAYSPAQLAFDGFGNLYVLNFCTYGCGKIKNSISIYAPGAKAPTTVLQPPSGSTFDNMAVSSAGYLAVTENERTSPDGPVVVYAPGTTVPAVSIATGLQYPGDVAFGN
jgi:hypothetical protein